MTPLLDVRGLSVTFATRAGPFKAVDDIDVVVERDEVLAIVGESGSGKSVTALSVMRLVGHGGGRITAGRIDFARRDGSRIDLASADGATMRDIRGAEIAMIFQEPMTSLNPVFIIEDQLTESIRTHMKLDKKAAIARAIDMLRLVGIPSPEKRIQGSDPGCCAIGLHAPPDPGGGAGFWFLPASSTARRISRTGRPHSRAHASAGPNSAFIR